MMKITIPNDEKLNPMTGNKAEITTSFFYLTLYWRVLTSTYRKKLIERIHIGKKEIKLSLLADDISIYKENPKNLKKKKLLELIQVILAKL